MQNTAERGLFYAHGLSALCHTAEQGYQSSAHEKKLILSDIESAFVAVKGFFQRRQI
jgi:hypothetical protein